MNWIKKDKGILFFLMLNTISFGQEPFRPTLNRLYFETLDDIKMETDEKYRQVIMQYAQMIAELQKNYEKRMEQFNDRLNVTDKVIENLQNHISNFEKRNTEILAQNKHYKDLVDKLTKENQEYKTKLYAQQKKEFPDL